jgi:H/ACA ribonucleoprotein complex subunit 1
MGTYMHAAKEFMVCIATNQKIPKFNTPIYLENKTQIGKIDEVFGPINAVVC